MVSPNEPNFMESSVKTSSFRHKNFLPQRVKIV
jgi:hypothetical protein